MRIGIDYTPALGQQAGIGRYTRELVSALLKQASRHEYVLIRARGSSSLPNDSSATSVTLPFSRRMSAIIWHRMRLPIALETFTGALDLYHATDYLIPPLKMAKGMVTVHDLSFLVHPELGAAGLVKYLRSALPESLDRASLVLADSQNTKKDIVELLGFAKERVEVVYCGVSEDFRPVEDPMELEQIRDKYGLYSPYILTLGTIEPRKNYVRLIQAYQQLRAENGIAHDLIIGGGKGWLYQDVFDEVKSLGLEKQVRFLGFVPDDDLPGMLSLAELFVYPSIYEGFGLPPLEAMACGTPVVASNTSCLPEILGDAAVFVDPLDVSSMANGMISMLSNDGLKNDMKARGIKRASRFTWAHSAGCLLKIYDRLEEVGL